MTTIPELKSICKRMGLHGYSNKNKSQLEAMVRAEIEPKGKTIRLPPITNLSQLSPTPSSRTRPLPPIPKPPSLPPPISREQSARDKRIQTLLKELNKNSEKKELSEMKQAEKRDINHQNLVQIVKDAKLRERESKEPSIYVKNVGKRPIAWYEEQLGVKLDPSDIKKLRWELNKAMVERQQMYTKENYDPDRQFNLVMSGKNRLRDGMEAKKVRKFKKAGLVIEKSLDPYLIKDLMKIVKGYMEPRQRMVPRDDKIEREMRAVFPM